MNKRELDEQDWNRLFDFLMPEQDELLDKDAKRLLARLQIDVQPFVRRIKDLIESKQAQVKLKNAGPRRRAILEKLKSLSLQGQFDLATLKQSVHQALKRDEIGAVYWNRLEDVDNPDDLRSLLEDISMLELMDDLDEDDASSLR